jgi:hypothetical protein
MTLSEPWGVVKGAPRILMRAELPGGAELKKSSGFDVDGERLLVRGLPSSIVGSTVEVTPATIIGSPSGPTLRARAEKPNEGRETQMGWIALVLGG